MSHHTFDDAEMDILADIIESTGMKDYCIAYAGCLIPLAKRLTGITVAFIDVPNSDNKTAYNMLQSFGNYIL